MRIKVWLWPKNKVVITDSYKGFLLRTLLSLEPLEIRQELTYHSFQNGIRAWNDFMYSSCWSIKRVTVSFQLNMAEYICIKLCSLLNSTNRVKRHKSTRKRKQQSSWNVNIILEAENQISKWEVVAEGEKTENCGGKKSNYSTLHL